MPLPKRITSIFLLIIFIIFARVNCSDKAITCRNEEGNTLPWFIIYKLPKIHESQNRIFRSGYGYSYLTPESHSWTSSQVSINESSSFVGMTLEPLYQKEDGDLAYILYNDHPPGVEKDHVGGHLKGILISNQNGGIWLQHSVPQFPVLGREYQYQAEETGRGQTFECFTLTVNEIERVASALLLTRPTIFGSRIPGNIAEGLPNIRRLLNVEKYSALPFWRSNRLLNLFARNSGPNIKIFSKSPEVYEEIYMEWIAPSLRSPLAVQSWLGGPDRLPSNCTARFPVYNAKVTGVGLYHFSTDEDHSKWAVSLDPQRPWVCLGDLNRRVNQLVRGGLTVCREDPNIWQVFKRGVEDMDDCQA